jgi:hypothetical protein
MLGQTLELNLPHQTGSRISMYVRKHFSIFSLYVRPTSVLLHFYLLQHLRTVVFSAKV